MVSKNNIIKGSLISMLGAGAMYSSYNIAQSIEQSAAAHGFEKRHTREDSFYVDTKKTPSAYSTDLNFGFKPGYDTASGLNDMSIVGMGLGVLGLIGAMGGLAYSVKEDEPEFQPEYRL